ncbi:hypothetical protein HY837_01110 [archaeon]|nr:hypothetical protein [archaeon]
MVEFNTMNYAPADRTMHEFESRSKRKIEAPIIPISELGVTVPENDPAGKFRSVVETVQAAIRRGSGQLQLVMTTSHQANIGGRAKSMGKEVREAVKSVLLANDAEIVGIELPTSMTNMSGLDNQRGVVSEEVRKQHLDEVRDAIKFAADIGQGGEIDVVSWEYPRNVFDASWNTEGKWKGAFKAPEEEKQQHLQFVNAETGKIQAQDAKHLPPPKRAVEQGIAQEGEMWDLKKYKEFAKKEGLDPETGAFELFKETVLGRELRQANRQKSMHEAQSIEYRERAEGIKQSMARHGEDPSKWPDEDKKKKYNAYKGFSEQEAIQAREQTNTLKQIETQISNLKPLTTFAKEKAVESYAEAGMMAMEETHNTKNLKRPISVGPELGWPHSYGGHPDEFIELIRDARTKMAERLKDKGYSSKQAEEQAKLHIKGTFDTAHMGMWLEKFKPELPWDTRVKEFNKWFMEHAEKLAKADVVGGIQVVDSHSAAHGHLPPGQGIFPVVDATKLFKKHGFTGYIVSEGHEEEKIGEGRIMLKTWEAFDAPIGSGYNIGVGSQPFRDIHQGYFGRQYAPRQMFGSYTPPNAEYKPWAGGKNPISFE